MPSEIRAKCGGPQCERATAGRGLCKAHWQQWRKGRNLTPVRPRLTLEQRYWSRVDRSGGLEACWLWTGRDNGRGYGQIKIGRRNHYAHRLAFLFAYGVTLPDDLCSLHTCDTPCCVRPDHLFVGTHEDNMADAAAKGRFPDRRGERGYSAKLTADDVRAIRRRHALGGTTQAAIARERGLHPGTISNIINRLTWKHVGASA